MQVQEIMSTKWAIIEPVAKIRSAAEMMREGDFGAIPVGENDRLVGMITDRDIAIRGVSEGKITDGTTVRDVMSESLYYCFDDEDVDRAAQLMAEHKVQRLPVVNREKRLVGVIALGDLARSDPASAALALSEVSQPTSAAHH